MNLAVYAVLQLALLGLLVVIVRSLEQLLQQAHIDRTARAGEIEDLKATADALAVRTAEIAKAVEQRDADANVRVDEQLSKLDRKLDVNTEMTSKAAEASAEAAHVANNANEKIAAVHGEVAALAKAQLAKGT